MRLELIDLVTAPPGTHSPRIGPVSLSLDVGETVALTGPNGAGKSTLLAAITGHAPVLSGECRIAAGSRIRLVEQDARPDRDLPVNGHDFLALAGAAPQPPLPLSGWLARRLDELSGGQRQLLRVWAGLTGPADVVLLDEPSNNLDARARHTLFRLLDRRPAGLGLLVVSHDAELVSRCARQVEMRPA
ncbi:ATP-binding cassette domain-containing protein [Guyparkeria sp.]|uniref:ATP-binding cassette domain-containing protein n=1 Tax=Guyparkeria sp. TaxID=2035736 RepID=UPI0039705819